MKEFNDSDIVQFDRFRKIRNGIKYYGEDCHLEDAQAALILAEMVVRRIQEILQGKKIQ